MLQVTPCSCIRIPRRPLSGPFHTTKYNSVSAPIRYFEARSAGLLCRPACLRASEGHRLPRFLLCRQPGEPLGRSRRSDDLPGAQARRPRSGAILRSGSSDGPQGIRPGSAARDRLRDRCCLTRDHPARPGRRHSGRNATGAFRGCTLGAIPGPRRAGGNAFRELAARAAHTALHDAGQLRPEPRQPRGHRVRAEPQHHGGIVGRCGY